jgi:hypothetical protein
MKKVMWVKFGWSDEYQGGPVDGNYAWMTEHAGEAHEAFNFLPAPNGTYCCYVPPHGASFASPRSDDPHGWLIICLAKRKKGKGVHVVGWYENATLIGHEEPSDFLARVIAPNPTTVGGFDASVISVAPCA